MQYNLGTLIWILELRFCNIIPDTNDNYASISHGFNKHFLSLCQRYVYVVGFFACLIGKAWVKKLL